MEEKKETKQAALQTSAEDKEVQQSRKFLSMAIIGLLFIFVGIVGVILLQIVFGTEVDPLEPLDSIPVSLEPTEAYEPTSSVSPTPTILEFGDITFKEVSYIVKNVNTFGRGSDEEVRIFMSYPEQWDVERSGEDFDKNGSECFNFKINSSLSNSYLNIKYPCLQSDDVSMDYLKPPQDAKVVAFLKDFYEGYSGGHKHILRHNETADTGYYGNVDSEGETVDFDRKSYKQEIGLIHKEGLDNHDVIKVSVFFSLDSDSDYFDLELQVFDSIVQSLFFAND